jgi:hypothetical protein
MIDGKGYAMVLFAASFFEMWAAGSVCDGLDKCEKEWAFAVAIGVISLCITLPTLILMMCMQPGGCLKIMEGIVSTTLFLLWLISVMICTFDKPFTTMCGQTATVSNNSDTFAYGAANGYITNWLCFIAAACWMSSSITFIDNLVTKATPSSLDGYLIGACGMFSVVAFTQAAYLCNNVVTGYGADSSTSADGCDSAHAWTIAWGTISLVLCLLMMFVKALDWLQKYITSLMAAVWIITVLAECFVYKNNNYDHTGIFPNAGNGFLACWFATLCSFAMAWCGWSGQTASEAFMHSGVYIPIIFVTSFFEFWAAAVLCDRMGGNDDLGENCKDEYAYAVSVGIIGMTLSLVQLLLRIFCKDCAAKTQFPIAVILFLWYFCGVAVMCFDKPFTAFCASQSLGQRGCHIQNDVLPALQDPNGYICTWWAFFASSMMLTENQMVQNAFNRVAAGAGTQGPILVLLIVCSCTVWVQAAYICGECNGCTSYQGWAIAAGIISMTFTFVVMLVTALKDFAKYVYAFLAVLWFCAVGTLTFSYKDADQSGLFADAGNGFLGCWGGLGLSILLCYIGWVDPDFSLSSPEEEGAEGDAEPGTEAMPGVEANPTAVEDTKTEPIEEDLTEAEVEVEVEEEGEPETAKV